MWLQLRTHRHEKNKLIAIANYVNKQFSFRRSRLMRVHTGKQKQIALCGMKKTLKLMHAHLMECSSSLGNGIHWRNRTSGHNRDNAAQFFMTVFNPFCRLFYVMYQWRHPLDDSMSIRMSTFLCFHNRTFKMTLLELAFIGYSRKVINRHKEKC